MLLCDLCGRPSDHFFLNNIDEERDFWLCHRCIDLKRHLLGFIADGCFNSMEVCRLLNGFEFNDFAPCYANRGFAYVTRRERCNYKERGCVFWSLTVYNALRKLERKRLVQSVKTIFYDERKGRGLRLDVFRFWFIQREAYELRVNRQKLDGYL